MDVDYQSITENLQKLCLALSSNPDGAFELAVSYLSSASDRIWTMPDEKLLCQKVYSQLASGSTQNADKFTECYQKVKNSLVLKQRTSILALLLALSEKTRPASNQQLFPIPVLATVQSTTALTGSASNSSKSTISSLGQSNVVKPLDSSHSLPEQNMALALQERTNERTFIRDAVLAATGVRTKCSIPPSRPMQILYSRIAHLGFLHDRLKEFIDTSSGLIPQGLMGEGLVSCIRDELTEYYRSVALLQSQAIEGLGGGVGSGGTLRRVSVWAQEPLHRMTWLANIAHTAHHKKGGELASCVHRFVRHGDERVATLAKRLLTALTYPLLLMLTRWLLHGEIDDPFNEFFIESRSAVPIDRMWHDKYRVREWMVPSFMSREQAAQILATGKSVVFMREACADTSARADHAHLLQALLTPAAERSPGRGDDAPAWWEAAGLREAVAAAHEAASQRLLAALTQHHHLLDHLAAHRRYLLLAQGDFVHHLMTLMQEELSKPATSLYVHNLSCTLEAAVRATNAQYEPPHVLARLHVNLYPNYDVSGDSRISEECGWDVFALQYRVDGPLGTLFPATCGAKYRALFTQLWRVKRIEYSLHEAWREHIILQKRLKNMPEVWGVMRRAACLRAEALRLCTALQEAGAAAADGAWDELMAAASQRKHLDQLLRLHNLALERQCVAAIIHSSTQELQSYLGNVLGETLALRSFEATLHTGIIAELERREHIEYVKAERATRNEYLLTAAEEVQDKEKRKIFHQFLASRKADLNVWARTYRGHVTALILKLALHCEVSLQTLAFRLDYSDFYKRGDSKLHEPLTYQHKRLSEIGLSSAKTKLIDRARKK